MNNTQIITILVSVVFILFIHYTITHSSCEHFGGGSGSSATTNYYTVTPVQFHVTNKLMQRLSTKLSDFVFKYSNRMYGDEVLSKNRALMKEIMMKAQNKSFKDILQMDLNQVNAMISYISSF